MGRARRDGASRQDLDAASNLGDWALVGDATDTLLTDSSALSGPHAALSRGARVCARTAHASRACSSAELPQPALEDLALEDLVHPGPDDPALKDLARPALGDLAKRTLDKLALEDLAQPTLE